MIGLLTTINQLIIFTWESSSKKTGVEINKKTESCKDTDFRLATFKGHVVSVQKTTKRLSVNLLGSFPVL